MFPDKSTLRPLNFDLLEDALVSPVDRAEKEIEGTRIIRIGPLVEYAFHQYKNAPDRLSKWSSNYARQLSEMLQTRNLSVVRNVSTVEPSQNGFEFMKTPQGPTESMDKNWRAFFRRLTNAGIKTGFSSEYSYAVAGTFGDMVSNAVEHCEFPQTAIAGYRWSANEFEYIVADAGIGVLKSLRRHLDYKDLTDASEALSVAIKDGNSRHGKNAGRGNGFHELIVNIANRNSYLRFRSGNYRLEIDGTKGYQPVQTLRKCAEFQGFLISVVCQRMNRSSS